MKILSIADQHYLLRKRGVGKEWLSDRIKLFHRKIGELIETKNIELVILAGDLFDKTPTIAEVGLFLGLLNITKRLNIPMIMIAGNHEATTKYGSFLQELEALQDENFKLILDQQQIKFSDVYITFMSYAEVKRQSKPLLPMPDWKNIMVSHVCGDLPPHVKEEYPISNFDGYDLTLLGDLHHYHKSLTGTNAWFHGSPYSISFSQAAETNKYGVFIIDTAAEEWEIPNFIPLSLPQLVTRRCSASEVGHVKQEVKDSLHCYKIEVEGTPEEMAAITDKDVIKKSIVSSTATIDLHNKTKEEELVLVLEHMGVINIKGVMELNATIKT